MEGSKSKSSSKAAASDAGDLGVNDGYIGTKVDPRPNSDYSLESGPDSPSALDVAVESARARADELEASAA